MVPIAASWENIKLFEVHAQQRCERLTNTKQSARCDKKDAFGRTTHPPLCMCVKTQARICHGVIASQAGAACSSVIHAAASRVRNSRLQGSQSVIALQKDAPLCSHANRYKTG